MSAFSPCLVLIGELSGLIMHNQVLYLFTCSLTFGLNLSVPLRWRGEWREIDDRIESFLQAIYRKRLMLGSPLKELFQFASA
jgi:hypothetical protein